MALVELVDLAEVTELMVHRAFQDIRAIVELAQADFQDTVEVTEQMDYQVYQAIQVLAVQA